MPTLALVSPTELQNELASELPPLVLQATSSSSATADAVVVPTAIVVPLVDLDVNLESAPGEPMRVCGNYSLLPPAKLRAALEALGIQHKRRCVVYTQSLRCGVIDLAVSARLAWCLSYAGVEDVGLLYGGFGAWRAAGLPTAHPTRPQPVADFFGGEVGHAFPACPQYDACTEEVEGIVKAATGEAAADTAAPQLADVRSWREFTGGRHDYPYALPHGRIPTARWAHWGPSTYIGGDFFGAASAGDGDASAAAASVLDLDCEATARLWKAWGLDVGPRRRRRIVFYCGSGWRSSLAWCVARLLGHDDCASYDGGFLEWAMLHPRATDHPIEFDDDRSRMAPTQEPAPPTTTQPAAAPAAPREPERERFRKCAPSGRRVVAATGEADAAVAAAGAGHQADERSERPWQRQRTLATATTTPVASATAATAAIAAMAGSVAEPVGAAMALTMAKNGDSSGAAEAALAAPWPPCACRQEHPSYAQYCGLFRATVRA